MVCGFIFEGNAYLDWITTAIMPNYLQKAASFSLV
jgi:hypothetical protein